MIEDAETILHEILNEIKEKDFQITVKFLEEGRSLFQITPVLDLILRDDRKEFFEGLMANYVSGRELYEKTLKGEIVSEDYQEYFEESRNTFLGLFKNSHEIGISRATDYLCFKVIRRFYTEINVSITFLEGDREYGTLGAYSKFDRNREKDETGKRAEIEKTVEFLKGYDKKANEAKANSVDNRKNRSLIIKIIEKFFRNE